MGRKGGGCRRAKNATRCGKKKRIVGRTHVFHLQSNGPYNFVPEAGPGCHICHDTSSQSSWILGFDTYDPEDYDQGASIPDVALDPYENTLSLTNVDGRETRVCYVTVYDVRVRGKDGHLLSDGMTRDDCGTTRICTTMIVLCPPRTFVHLCHIDVSEVNSIADVEIDSDVQPWKVHPHPEDFHPFAIGFPLACCDLAKSMVGENAENLSTRSSYLCTQGEHGHLTHFFSGNLHAVDFRCEVGTPVVAVADGSVVEVRQDHELTGIAVSNLFKWNSILICVDTDGNEGEEENISVSSSSCLREGMKDSLRPLPSSSMGGGPLFVEYVHISANSALVKPGDRVVKGQVICLSGSVGFSPEPHLHFAAYRSKDPEAPTVRVHFQTNDRRGTFVPKAGQYYNSNGVVSVPTEDYNEK